MLLSSEELDMASVDLPVRMRMLHGDSGGVRNTNAPADMPAEATQAARHTSNARRGGKARTDSANDHWRAHFADDPQGTDCDRSIPPASWQSQRPKVISGRPIPDSPAALRGRSHAGDPPR